MRVWVRPWSRRTCRPWLTYPWRPYVVGWLLLMGPPGPVTHRHVHTRCDPPGGLPYMPAGYRPVGPGVLLLPCGVAGPIPADRADAPRPCGHMNRGHVQHMPRVGLCPHTCGTLIYPMYMYPMETCHTLHVWAMCVLCLHALYTLCLCSAYLHVVCFLCTLCIFFVYIQGRGILRGSPCDLSGGVVTPG